ncbi:hypothetical protein [Peptostreptococcus equinus]|uniref:Phage protein n=1 Tax=Peptostreptococcus equinus TaxID=3003601 RepID=A0ABY7JU75_9FIRM|nr:hypothetical protein [Peptostreptococcus sp. CBA3647]WAW15277.1 hypothetical protein O0R46_02160 [Peptostreptococcus sp. CBA3647]
MLDKIKIGWKTYNIEKATPDRKLQMGPDEYAGMINYNDEKIYINDECSEGMQNATLVHEILHGISDMYKIDELDESVLTRLGDAIYTVLVDNGLEIRRSDK